MASRVAWRRRSTGVAAATADGQRARLAHERAAARGARLGIGAPRAQQGPVVLGELDAGVPREGVGVVAARREPLRRRVDEPAPPPV